MSVTKAKKCVFVTHCMGDGRASRQRLVSARWSGVDAFARKLVASKQPGHYCRVSSSVFRTISASRRLFINTSSAGRDVVAELENAAPAYEVSKQPPCRAC